MGGIRDLTLGELTAALTRYRPVAVTVVVILLVIALAPDRDPPGTEATGFQPDPSVAPTATVPPAGPTDSTVPSPTDAAPITITPTPSFAAPARDSSSPAAGSAEPGSFGATDEPTNTTPEGDAPLDPQLRIAAKAWASRSAGTPLAAEGVPTGSLPVGTRFTQDDKLSFVRLAGTDEVLRLVENPAGNRDTSGPAAVRACQVTEANWVEGEAMAFEEAPVYDAGACVEGARSEDGVWSFDLASFPSPTDTRGIALVPGAEAGIDFQVAFQAA